jgi:penicillin-binding protein 1A
LSIAIGEADSKPGHNNVYEEAKRGRAKIIQTARAMGITTPLPDTVSLPIGADEVKLIDMASAYATFANGGYRAPPYAAVEIMNSRGELIYKHDRDAPPLARIIAPGYIADMITMMKNVVENGTGKRARLDNIEVAGKTGTTNGYKDAWFVGYTGNYVCAVWFGNDNDAPMNNMTGGSLPAGTWHEIMAYAHQGIELKPLPGGSNLPEAPQVAAAPSKAPGIAELGTPQRPASLSRRSAETLNALEAALKNVGGQRTELDRAPVTYAGASLPHGAAQ